MSLACGPREGICRAVGLGTVDLATAGLGTAGWHRRHDKGEIENMQGRTDHASGLLARIPWSLVRQLLLTLFAIYLIGSAIMLSVQLLECFECATPFTVGAVALLIALLAKFVVREQL